VQHATQTPVPDLAGNQSSSSECQALAETTPSGGFAVHYGEPSDRLTVQFLPPDDKSYGGIASTTSGSGLPDDIHRETIEPSYLPQGVEVLNQQIQNKPSTHYDFNSLFTHDSKLGMTQIDHNIQLSWSSGPSRASQPPLQELVYHSDIRKAASALLTQSYQGSANWPIFLPQHDPSLPQLTSNLHSSSVPVTPDHEYPLKPEDRLWEESIQVSKTSQEGGLRQNEQDVESRNGAVQEEIPLLGIQYQHPSPSDTKKASLLVSLYPNNQNLETSYPSEEDIFDKSDDEMGVDESDQDMQAYFGTAYEDHLQSNDLGIVVALQASQDMQEQRLRTYHSFLDGPNILTSYQPSARSSPLNDSTAARIFYHFVNVTGPSISLYERHPANPSLMFQGRPVPRSQQHIWACKRIYLSLIVTANPSSRHHAYACPK
jgi:hypothetical protein